MPDALWKGYLNIPVSLLDAEGWGLLRLDLLALHRPLQGLLWCVPGDSWLEGWG